MVCFFVGIFGFECSWPFPFLFLFSVRWTSHRRTGFWLAIKGRGPLYIVVSFPFCLLGDNSVFVQMSDPKTFLHISFVFFWSLIGNFVSFLLLFSSLNLWFRICSFCFVPLFWLETFLLLLSSALLIGNFSLYVFFRGQGLTFSPWVKVYGKLGFWLKAYRMAGHDIC